MFPIAFFIKNVYIYIYVVNLNVFIVATRSFTLYVYMCVYISPKLNHLNTLIVKNNNKLRFKNKRSYQTTILLIDTDNLERNPSTNYNDINIS